MGDKREQKDTNLTGRQQRVLNALLFSTSITHASEVSGVSRQRIHLWLRDEQFKDELQRARQAVRQDSVEHLKILFTHSVDTLGELLLNALGDDRLRLKACEVVLNYNIQVIELGEIDARLRQLENRTNESKGS